MKDQNQDRNQEHQKTGAAFVLACLGLLLSSTVAVAEDAELGRFISIRGTVEYQAAEPGPAAGKEGQVKTVSFGPWQKAQPKQTVRVNDRFRTSKKSRLKILFKDKSLFALGPKTEVTMEQFLFEPDSKLRQSVVNIAHGLSMYIVNKQSTHPESRFEMKTPTAVLSARGTKGFFSATHFRTLVANQAGSVDASNSNPEVPGNVNVGAMMKSVIEEGKPPTTPAPLAPGERALIERIVNGLPQSPLSGEATTGNVVVELQQGDYEAEDFTESYEFFDDSDAESCQVN